MVSDFKLVLIGRGFDSKRTVVFRTITDKGRRKLWIK